MWKCCAQPGSTPFAYVKNQAQRPTTFDIIVPVLTGGLSIHPDYIVIRPETFSPRDMEAAAEGGSR